MNIYRRDVQATLKEEFSIATIECSTVHWAQLWSQRGRSEGSEDVSGRREMSFKMGSTFEIPSTWLCLLPQFQVLTAFLLHAHVLAGSLCFPICVPLSLAPTCRSFTCHIFAANHKKFPLLCQSLCHSKAGLLGR